MVDVLALDRGALDANIALMDKLSEADLGKPTPCEGWTVRDLLEHLVDSSLFFATAVRGGDPEPRPGADLVEAYRISADRLTEAFATEGFLDRDAHLSTLGTRPGKAIVAVHFVDHLVHAWDIAKSIGVDARLDEELAGVAYEMTLNYPTPPEAREGDDASFAPVVEVPDDASVTDKLVALMGRRPDWTA